MRIKFSIVTFILLLFSLPGLARAQGWQSFTSDSGALSFSYPSGWQVFATERTPSRYVENYAAQPRGQEFSGYSGQVAVRVFDPMYVIEEARVRINASNDTIFQRFVRATPGGGYASFGRRTLSGSSYLSAIATSEGIRSEYLGFTNGSGYMVVVAIAMNPRESARHEALLGRFVQSVRSSSPPSRLDGPATAVRDWYHNLQTGNSRALYGLACRQALGSMLLLSFASQGAMDRMTYAARGFDFGDLRFQTIMSGARGAAVRVSGNVVDPRGAITPLYQNAQLLGGSNTRTATWPE